MIHHLTLTNVGPVADLSLPLDAPVIVRGRSGAGKTNIIDATVCLLTGGDLRIARGAKAATVTGATKAGLTLTARATPSGTVRSVTPPDGEVVKAKSKADFIDLAATASSAMVVDPAARERRAALVRGYLREPLVRAVCDPREIPRLLAVDGKALTDLLASVLPVDVEGALSALMTEAGAELRKSDPRHAKGKNGAEELVREANRRRDQAEGAHTQARARLTEAEAAMVPSVDPQRLADARAAVASLDLWAAHDAAMARHTAAVDRAIASEKAAAAWDEAEAAAGPRPEHNAARAHQVRTEIGNVRRAIQDAERAAAAAAKAEADAAKAAAEAERVAAAQARADLEAERAARPAPAMTLFAAPARPVTTCPECGHTWSPDV